jgi:predicted GNAT family acetyltransferase
MAERNKIRYEIDLRSWSSVSPDAGMVTRTLGHEDRDDLAHLILDAYRGTIDYEGETLVEAKDAIDEWLEDSPMLEASFGVHDGESLVSATLLQVLDSNPFVRAVMTHPDHKSKGYGTAAVEATLSMLRSSGHQKVVFYTTEGNTASETLFKNLGAIAVPRHP